MFQVLFAAAMVGHTETVATLVAAGADVEQADAMGRTPLYAAAQEGHVVAVEALLAAGAQVGGCVFPLSSPRIGDACACVRVRVCAFPLCSPSHPPSPVMCYYLC